MKTNLKIAAAVLAVSAMALAGCSSSSSSESSSSEAAPATSAAASEAASMAPLRGPGLRVRRGSATKGLRGHRRRGVDDKGFNQKAYKGVTDAAEQLGVEAAVLESTAETAYAPNIQSFVDQGCGVIVTVGFLLGDATMEAANANPDIPFTIVDYAYGENEDGIR